MLRILKAAHPWVCCLILFAGCSLDNEPTTALQFRQPEHFPPATYTFQNNPVTPEGFRLGRKLFFDPALSRDGSVSCNSCHIQGTAFADSQQHPLSVGVDDKRGIRNAPSLANMAFLPEFFWDGGVTHLDFVPINAIESDFEMDETLSNVVRKLNGNEEYRQLFNEAFGIQEVTSPYMLHALSQFMVMMVSDNSRYDQYLKGEEDVLDAYELQGMELFTQKCGACHSGALLTDHSYRNNGLSESFTDTGRARISESSADEGKFRVPGLRNVALTAPYMHSGRFETLRQVLDHYDTGIIQSETLDPLLDNGIPMTDSEKDRIVAFLKTLSDQEFRSNPIFQNQ